MLNVAMTRRLCFNSHSHDTIDDIPGRAIIDSDYGLSMSIVNHFSLQGDTKTYSPDRLHFTSLQAMLLTSKGYGIFSSSGSVRQTTTTNTYPRQTSDQATCVRDDELSLHIPLIRLNCPRVSVTVWVLVHNSKERAQHARLGTATPYKEAVSNQKPREEYKGRGRRTAPGAAAETALNTQPLALRSTRVVRHALITNVGHLVAAHHHARIIGYGGSDELT